MDGAERCGKGVDLGKGEHRLGAYLDDKPLADIRGRSGANLRFAMIGLSGKWKREPARV
jgi:hypothetical protein